MNLLASCTCWGLGIRSEELLASIHNADSAGRKEAVREGMLAAPFVACFGTKVSLMLQVGEDCLDTESVDQADTRDRQDMSGTPSMLDEQGKHSLVVVGPDI